MSSNFRINGMDDQNTQPRCNERAKNSSPAKVGCAELPLTRSMWDDLGTECDNGNRAFPRTASDHTQALVAILVAFVECHKSSLHVVWSEMSEPFVYKLARSKRSQKDPTPQLSTRT